MSWREDYERGVAAAKTGDKETAFACLHEFLCQRALVTTADDPLAAEKEAKWDKENEEMRAVRAEVIRIFAALDIPDSWWGQLREGAEMREAEHERLFPGEIARIRAKLRDGVQEQIGEFLRAGQASS